MNRIAKFFRDYAFARFFLPVGVFLIVFGVSVFGIVNTRKNYPQANAVVSRCELYEEEHFEGDDRKEATYQVFVKYNIDGKEYESEYGIVPEMEIGTIVRIDYNPDNPSDISQPTGFLLPLGMIAGGIAALAAGLVSIFITRKKNEELRRQEEEWNHVR